MYAQALQQDSTYNWFWTFNVAEDLEDNLSYVEDVVFEVYFDGRLRNEVTSQQSDFEATVASECLHPLLDFF